MTIKITRESSHGVGNILDSLSDMLGRLGAEVDVGWSEEWTDAETVEIAAVNTLGGLKNGRAAPPARNALTPAFQNNRKERTKMMGKLLVKVRKDPSALRAEVEKLAEQEAEWLREAVRGLDNPPNAPSTVDRKGFNDPLIGSGGDGGRILAGVGAKGRVK